MKCEATTNPILYWDSDKIDFVQCSRDASVNIDRINLCLQHAGSIAVQKLIASGECKKLDKKYYQNSPLCMLSEDRWKRHIRQMPVKYLKYKSSIKDAWRALRDFREMNPDSKVTRIAVPEIMFRESNTRKENTNGD